MFISKRKMLWLLSFKDNKVIYDRIKLAYKLDDNWDKCASCGFQLSLVKKIKRDNIVILCEKCGLAQNV